MGCGNCSKTSGKPVLFHMFTIFLPFGYEILLMLSQGKNITFRLIKAKCIDIHHISHMEMCRNDKKNKGMYSTKAV